MEAANLVDSLAPPVPRTNFLRNVGYHFKCSICLDVVKDPVSLQCGHIFCKECIKQSAEISPVCPLCKQRCDLRTMVDEMVVSKLVELAEELAEQCGVDDILESQLEVDENTQCSAVANEEQPSDGAGSCSNSSRVAAKSVTSCSQLPQNSQSRLAATLLQLNGGKATGPSQPHQPPPEDLSVAPSAPFPPITVDVQPKYQSVVNNFMSLTQGMQLTKTQWVDDGSDSEMATHSPWRLPRAPSVASSQTCPSLPVPRQQSVASSIVGVKRKRDETSAQTQIEQSKSEERASCDSDDTSQESEQQPEVTHCHLCRLDTVDRKLMRQYLKYIIRNDPTCVKDDIRGIDQTQIESMLGAMCGPFSAGASSGEEPGKSVFAHYLCLLWSSEVFMSRGELRNGQEAIVRSETQQCAFCGSMGATVGCSHQGCDKSFHVPCAFLTGPGVCGVVEDRYEVYCAEHYPK